VANLEHAVQTLQEKQSRAQVEYEACQSALEESQHAYQQSNDHVESLTAEIHTAMAAKETAECALGIQQARLHDFEDALDVVKRDLLSSQQRCEQLADDSNRATELEALLEECRSRNHFLAQELEACQATTSSLRIEITEALDCAQAAETTKAAQAHELESVRDKMGILQARCFTDD
jgi:chromosome segregation ATPase